MKIKQYLKDEALKAIDSWSEDEIYAISFYVYQNISNEYKGYANTVEFHVSYNTESDCPGAGAFDEERWNYAFWRQDTTTILDPFAAEDKAMDMIIAHYKNDWNNVYEKLLALISTIARELQLEGVVTRKFGKIPIIVHGLEISPLIIEATTHANPNGEADTFLQATKDW